MKDARRTPGDAQAQPGRERVRPEHPVVNGAGQGGARAWVAIVLAVGTALLYARVAGHQFLHYDDNVYVTENPHVLGGLSWSGVVWAFTSPEAWYGFPLDWLSHMLDVQLFGPSPGAHHLVNVAPARRERRARVPRARAPDGDARAQRRRRGALRGAPAARGGGGLGLRAEGAALRALSGSSRSGPTRYAERPSVRRYVLVALVFAASLLAKPMWVTLPFLLLLLDAWPLRRAEGLMAVAACFDLPSDRASTSSARADPRTARPEPVDGRAVVGSTRAITAISRLALEKVPLLVIAAATLGRGVPRPAARRGAARDGARLRIAARLRPRVVRALPRQGALAVLAVRALPAPGSEPPGWQAVGAMLLLGVATVLAIRQARRRPWIPVGWLWFAGMLVPVIGLVKAGRHGIADRYMYAPGIGLFVAVVWLVAELGERFPLQRASRVFAAAVILALAALSWRQQAYWADHVTLFTHAVEVTPHDGLAHHILSQGLAAKGRYPEALVHAREAARLEPGDRPRAQEPRVRALPPRAPRRGDRVVPRGHRHRARLRRGPWQPGFRLREEGLVGGRDEGALGSSVSSRGRPRAR